jgi:hypothetical protein
MALAYNVVKKLPLSSKTIVDITLDNAYPANGYVLSNTGLGVLDSPHMVDLDIKTAQGFTPVWDQVNSKLKMYKSAGAAGQHTECASADLTSSVVVRAEVTCMGGVIV